MKYINKEVLSILSRVKDLLPLERKMREDRNVVIPLPSTGGKDSLSPADRLELSKSPRSAWQSRFAKSQLHRPWKRIPSIWKFEIHLSVHDWLLLLFNLFKRYDSATTLYAWKNGDANKYIDYMFKRLSKEVKAKEFDKARDTMWLLMGSHSYLVCCFNYVAKGWYKSMELNEAKRTLRKVKKLVKAKATKIDYKRVYLEEPTKFRPLGVPTLAWRVYLHMYNNLITQWRMVTEDGTQHAYLPGKGVISAWEKLFELIHTEPNIYEADFKGFFNNVTHKGLRLVLNELGFPKSELKFITFLNQSVPKLTKEDKIEEPDRKIIFDRVGKLTENAYIGQSEFQERIVSNWEGRIPGEKIIQGDIRNYTPKDPREMLTILNGMLISTPQADGKYSAVGDRPPDRPLTEQEIKYFKYVNLIKSKQPFTRNEIANQWGISPDRPSVQWEYKTIGVPQGAPTSCSLATLVLRKLSERCKVLLYADDVIYFPKEADDDHALNISSKYLGLIVAHNKSRQSKRNHEWITDHIKFLGFKYFPESYYDTIWESMGYYVWVILCLDLILIGFPLFSLLFMYIAYRQRWERHKPKFRADTRNGATLEFGDKESLIMYLNNARTLLLNSSAGDYLGGPNLSKFLVTNYAKWLKIHNPIALLFELNTHKKLKPENWTHAHIPLTGWMMARMQSNSWNLSVKQDFRLKPIKKSWVNLCWASYSRSLNLPLNAISTFTASSFACHDLLMWRDRKSVV